MADINTSKGDIRIALVYYTGDDNKPTIHKLIRADGIEELLRSVVENPKIEVNSNITEDGVNKLLGLSDESDIKKFLDKRKNSKNKKAS